jgi:signal peptidase II
MARYSKSSNSATLWRWLALALAVVLIDQLSKLMVIATWPLGDGITVNPWLNLIRAHNSGAAFSFLAGASGWQRWFFVGLGSVASVMMIWMIARHAAQTLFCAAISLILGGAVGNVIDRLWHGYVIDFIQVHHSGWYFPSFNAADSAITLGAILLIVDELRRVRRG